ncbi:hypothetical protein M514_08832, partial [Trichuris suis]
MSNNSDYLNQAAAMENSEGHAPSATLEIGQENSFECSQCDYRCLNSDEAKRHDLCHKVTSSTICNPTVTISDCHSSESFNEGSPVVVSQDFMAVNGETRNVACTVGQDKQTVENDVNGSVNLATGASGAEQECFTVQPSDDVQSKAEQVKLLPSSACSSLECAVDVDLTVEGNEVGPSSHFFSLPPSTAVHPTQDCLVQKNFIVSASNASMSKKAEVDEALLHTENPSTTYLVDVDLTTEKDIGSKSTPPSLVPQISSPPNQHASGKSLSTGESRVGIVHPVVTAIKCTVLPTAHNTSSTSNYTESDKIVLQSSSDTVSAVEPTNEPDSLRVSVSESIGTLPTRPDPNSSGLVSGNQSESPNVCQLCGTARFSRNEPRLRRMMSGKVWTLTNTYRYVADKVNGRK